MPGLHLAILSAGRRECSSLPVSRQSVGCVRSRSGVFLFLYGWAWVLGGRKKHTGWPGCIIIFLFL